MNLQLKFGYLFIISVLGSLSRFSAFLGPKIAERLIKKNGIQFDSNVKISSFDGTPIEIDVYTPKGKMPLEGWRTILLVHGGGFQFFSKESHAVVAVKLAALGYKVFSCNYRLTPEFPFPFGLMDVISVYDWMNASHQEFKINRNELVLVAESAGANFSLGLALLASGIAELPSLNGLEKKFNLQQWSIPKKMVLHCGYLQVSDTERFSQMKISRLVQYRTQMIQKKYLPASLGAQEKEWELADPLCVLEKLASQNQKLPAHFSKVLIPVGGSDPVLDDSLRLKKVFEKLEHTAELKVYDHAPHALYAMPWHGQYEKCWNDIARFLV